MHQTILVVEDDPIQLEQLDTLLTDSGFFVLRAPDYESAERTLFREEMDLLLLDLRLVDRNGMEILQMVKRMKSDFPVVILSSIANIGEKVSAFEIGVDDYITKPYHPAELVLRVKRLLKNRPGDEWRAERIITLGEAEFDITNGVVKKGKQQFFLRKKVMDLLFFFYNNRNQIISKEQIIEAVWSGEYVDENVISVTVHEIRQAIEAEPKKPRILQTVKGLGYRLNL